MCSSCCLKGRHSLYKAEINAMSTLTSMQINRHGDCDIIFRIQMLSNAKFLHKIDPYPS